MVQAIPDLNRPAFAAVISHNPVSKCCIVSKQALNVLSYLSVRYMSDKSEGNTYPQWIDVVYS